MCEILLKGIWCVLYLILANYPIISTPQEHNFQVDTSSDKQFLNPIDLFGEYWPCFHWMTVFFYIAVLSNTLTEWRRTAMLEVPRFGTETHRRWILTGHSLLWGIFIHVYQRFSEVCIWKARNWRFIVWSGELTKCMGFGGIVIRVSFHFGNNMLTSRLTSASFIFTFILHSKNWRKMSKYIVDEYSDCFVSFQAKV